MTVPRLRRILIYSKGFCKHRKDGDYMFQDMSVAKYFLSKDAERKLFNKELICKNGRNFYEGNARLNKYLHLAQNIYIAKTGKKLFEEDLFAYDNGAVAPAVQENYSVLVSRGGTPILPPEICEFLDKIYRVFENASLDELIELSHEDTEWRDKHGHYSKAEQRMDSMAHVEEYKVQYRDVIKVMGRISL